MIVATRAFRDRTRTLLWWSIAVSAMVLLIASMFPSIAGNEALEKMFDDMPAAVKMLAGAPEGISIVSPAGYLHSKLFALTLPLLLMIFGIGIGAHAIGGSEDDGTLELLLSNPVTRVRVAVERFVAMLALMSVLAIVAAVTMIATNMIVGEGLDDIPVGRTVAAVGASTCVAMVHASIAFAAGCVLGRRTPAIAVAAGLAVAGYMIEGLTATSNGLQFLGAPSPWHWYLDGVIIVDGPSMASIVLPLAVSAALAIVGIAVFVRRDLR